MIDNGLYAEAEAVNGYTRAGATRRLYEALLKAEWSLVGCIASWAESQDVVSTPLTWLIVPQAHARERHMI